MAAKRVSQDPATRVIVGWQGSERQAVRTNTVNRFETETLIQKENLEGLGRLNVQWMAFGLTHAV